MRGRSFQAFCDCLGGMNSALVVPEVVLIELEGHLKRKAHQLKTEHVRAVKKLQRLGLLQKAPSPWDFDPGLAVNQYMAHLKKALAQRDATILKPEDDSWYEALRRVGVRAKPSKQKDRDITDVMIWLGAMDHAKRTERAVAFISRNTRDFCKGGDLHPRLQHDLSERGVEVAFYSSLEEFIAAWATPVEFITKEWLGDNIDWQALEEELTWCVRENEDDYVRQIWLDDGSEAWRPDRASVDIAEWRLDDFAVYEFADGHREVMCLLSSDLDCTLVYEEQVAFGEYSEFEHEAQVLIGSTVYFEVDCEKEELGLCTIESIEAL